MRKNIVILFLIFLYSTGFAQTGETRDLGSFNELSVSEGIKVSLVRGSTEKAEISADNIDIEDVITKISGNHLRIHLEGNNHRNVDVEIRLTYRVLDEISISSAAKITASEAIAAQSMEIDVSSAGKGKLILDAGAVEIDISSAGKLELSGNAERIEIDVSSAGSLDAYALTCRRAEIDASSAGSVKITVSDKIDASASSGGRIRYKGDPDKVYADSNSGGNVKKWE